MIENRGIVCPIAAMLPWRFLPELAARKAPCSAVIEPVTAEEAAACYNAAGGAKGVTVVAQDADVLPQVPSGTILFVEPRAAAEADAYYLVDFC